MSKTKEKDIFFVILAIISFLADFLTLGQFVVSQTFQAFWTFTWFMSIVFIILLAVGGFVFLLLSGNEDSAELMLILFGGGYTIASLILYMFFAYEQTIEKNTTGDYFGFLVLLSIVCGIGLFGISYEDKEMLRYPSYGFAAVNLAYVFLLVNKYVLKHESFSFWQFTGEVIILVIGAGLFLTTFMASEK